MIEIRYISELDHLKDAVRLQKLIWGFEDIELLPVRLFVVANKVGGQTFGAFEDGRMIAFLLAIPGLKPGGKYYLHSHMMGVMAEYRNAGIGRMLKLAQREHALENGVELIEWTFDPLELKNAFFNIERLGAVIRRYVRNQYGTTSSHLHGGLPTDRCVPEWHIGSERVKSLLAGAPLPRPEITARISIPNEISTLRRHDPATARAIQSEASDRFDEYFDQGMTVVGFDRGETHGTYLFARE